MSSPSDSDENKIIYIPSGPDRKGLNPETQASIRMLYGHRICLSSSPIRTQTRPSVSLLLGAFISIQQADGSEC